jgi:hypothetical protein
VTLLLSAEGLMFLANARIIHRDLAGESWGLHSFLSERFEVSHWGLQRETAWWGWMEPSRLPTSAALSALVPLACVSYGGVCMHVCVFGCAFAHLT